MGRTRVACQDNAIERRLRLGVQARKARARGETGRGQGRAQSGPEDGQAPKQNGSCVVGAWALVVVVGVGLAAQ